MIITFLQCIDGIYSKKESLLVLGAMNRPWLIDPSMRRQGRFGKIILIPPPDLEARKKIFEIHLNKLINRNLIDSDVDLDELALVTKGYSGADIEAICKEARDIPLKEAIKGGKARLITKNDFANAISSMKPSIKPWITEALRSIKRYQAEEFYQPIQELASTYKSG